MSSVAETPASIPVAPALAAPHIRSALFGIATRPPATAPRGMLWLISALVAQLVLWAALAKLDIVAVAQGRLVPQTYLKIVQPSTAGIVREILVKEGDAVEEGQVLLRLDRTESHADRSAIERELASQQLQVRRIDAELTQLPLQLQANDDPTLFANAAAQQRAHRQAFLDARTQQQAAADRAEKELAAAQEQVRKLEMMAPSFTRTAEAYEKLAKQHLVGSLQAEEIRRAAIENQQNLKAQRATVAALQAAVTEATRKLEQLTSTYNSDLQIERQQAISKIGQLQQQQVKAAFQQRNLELRAPQAGKVKELATTTVGAVVQPGTMLVSLVPQDEPLLAEVSIDNQDIGFVQPGHAVRLKLATYPFQRYGMLDGVVQTVIADAQTRTASVADSETDHRSEGGVASTMSFKATIALQQQTLNQNGLQLPLAAGMQLSAEIIEGQRTVLQYLLSPLQRVVSEAGMER